VTETAEETVDQTTPPAEGGEATPKEPVSLNERISKAVAKGRTSQKHKAFIEWVETNSDMSVDVDSVVVTMAMYNEYRKTPEFKALATSLKAETAATKAMPEPKTPEEAAEQIKKLQAEAERAAEAQKRREERLQRAQAILAAASGEGVPATAEAPAEASEPESAENAQPEEAF
jgi:hypothetical protein